MTSTFHPNPRSARVPELLRTLRVGLRSGVAASFSLLVACAGLEESPEPVAEGARETVLGASVRLGGSAPTAFVADDVVARIGSTSGQGRELVIYARASDFGETLAFVIDLNAVTLPGVVDLSTQGVIYLEPGLGSGGSDLLFDGLPQGVLELEAAPTPGALVSGSFSFFLPGTDPGRGGEELVAQLEGSLTIQVIGN